jgi:hypothetical protein
LRRRARRRYSRVLRRCDLRKELCLLVCAALALQPSSGFAQSSQDTEVARGIKLVEDGEYDAAILTLDTAARRMAQDPKRSRDLSLAYLYLGIAYIGKGHEAAARARFREALQQAGDLTLSPEKFPPKVINVFESARDEIRAVSGGPASAKPPKKGGAGKALLIGALAVGAGGAAIAAGGGGGGGSSSGGSTSAPSDTRTTLQFSGTVASQEQKGYTFTATKAGVAEVKLSWQDTQLELRIDCQDNAPPYSGCGGQSNRTTNTTANYTTTVVQAKTYLIVVSNFSSRAGAEPYMVQILHP